MKMRTAMRSVEGICELNTEVCAARYAPQALEVIYLGPFETPTAVCVPCLKKQQKEGQWAILQTGTQS